MIYSVKLEIFRFFFRTQFTESINNQSFSLNWFPQCLGEEVRGKQNVCFADTYNNNPYSSNVESFSILWIITLLSLAMIRAFTLYLVPCSYWSFCGNRIVISLNQMPPQSTHSFPILKKKTIIILSLCNRKVLDIKQQ